MKNLNRTIEEGTTPNLGLITLVNRKFLYGLCAVLFFLICSLTTKANTSTSYRHSYHYGYGFFYGSFSGSGTSATDLYDLPYTLGFSSPNSTYFEDSACTSCSPLTNNYGSNLHSGADKWIQIDVADAGYLNIVGGTSDFDSVFYLFDSSWNLITSGDDGSGSGDNYGRLTLQPDIQIYANAGTYYLIVDGTDKLGDATSGTVNISYSLQ